VVAVAIGLDVPEVEVMAIAEEIMLDSLSGVRIKTVALD